MVAKYSYASGEAEEGPVELAEESLGVEGEVGPSVLKKIWFNS